MVTRMGLLLVLGSGVSWVSGAARQPQEGARKPASSESDRAVSSADTLPHRILERRSEGGGRSRSVQTLAGLSVNGALEPIREIQNETVRLDARTTRTIRRVFTRAADGSLRMAEQTEETVRTLPGGRTRVEATTSTVDLNGRLGPSERRIREAEPAGAGVTRSRTSVLTPDINAGFTQTLQIDETETRGPGGAVEIREVERGRDANRGWEVRRRIDRVIRPEAGGARTEEEQLYRRDFEGKTFLAERTVARETRDAQGNVLRTEETSRRNAAALPLEIDSRVRTVATRLPDGALRTVEELERRRLDSPREGLRVVQKSVETLRPDGRGGSHGDRRVEGLDPNGRLVPLATIRITETSR